MLIPRQFRRSRHTKPLREFVRRLQKKRKPLLNSHCGDISLLRSVTWVKQANITIEKNMVAQRLKKTEKMWEAQVPDTNITVSKLAGAASHAINRALSR